MNGSDNGSEIGIGLLGLTLLPLVLLFLLWLLIAGIAGFIAMDRGRSGFGFFLVTFFFLGPLGIAVALLAAREENGVPVGPPVERRPIPPGRRRGECLRCGAHTDVLEKDVAAFECWQCGNKLSLKPRPVAKA
jgi:DNA-directed RNA polymerase subunit RPC12/RpoP